MSINYDGFAFPKPPKKEKKKQIQIKGKKHKRTKETDIEKATKLIVWKRDGQRCIFCHKAVSWNFANAHYIKRSAGGLGIPENLFTACSFCHIQEDNGLNSDVLKEYAKNYLKSIYGPDWKESDLYFKKFKEMEDLECV